MAFLESGTGLAIWFLVATACVVVLLADLRRNNAHLPSLMKWVWALTVAYSGPFGLAVYFYSGRKEIAEDSLWRRGFRSTAHCYSGCGMGEIIGVVIAVGFLSLGNGATAAITFALAYVFGFLLTLGPLMQEGVGFRQAMSDAFWSESASITVMEVTAISVDLLLAAQATIGEPRFWWSLVLSLSAGLLAAYPVNVLLIRWGVKEGMHSPRHGA